MAEVYFEKAKQVANSLIIQCNGTQKINWNGSAAATLNITPSIIGAAASNHSHNWSQISGKPSVLTVDNILTSLENATNNSNVLGAKLVADLLNQSTLSLLTDITDFNTTPDGLWMIDKLEAITNSPPNVQNGILFQHTVYIQGSSVIFENKYQIMIRSDARQVWTRMQWYNSWHNWFLVSNYPSYGSSLPSSGTEGDIFLLYS